MTNLGERAKSIQEDAFFLCVLAAHIISFTAGMVMVMVRRSQTHKCRVKKVQAGMAKLFCVAASKIYKLGAIFWVEVLNGTTRQTVDATAIRLRRAVGGYASSSAMRGVYVWMSAGQDDCNMTRARRFTMVQAVATALSRIYPTLSYHTPWRMLAGCAGQIIRPLFEKFGGCWLHYDLQRSKSGVTAAVSIFTSSIRISRKATWKLFSLVLAIHGVNAIPYSTPSQASIPRQETNYLGDMLINMPSVVVMGYFIGSIRKGWVTRMQFLALFVGLSSFSLTETNISLFLVPVTVVMSLSISDPDQDPPDCGDPGCEGSCE